MDKYGAVSKLSSPGAGVLSCGGTDSDQDGIGCLCDDAASSARTTPTSDVLDLTTDAETGAMSEDLLGNGCGTGLCGAGVVPMLPLMLAGLIAVKSQRRQRFAAPVSRRLPASRTRKGRENLA